CSTDRDKLRDGPEAREAGASYDGGVARHVPCWSIEMRIEFEAAVPIDEPTPEEVEHGLRSLRLPDNSFAILEASPGSYIQAAGDEDSFDLRSEERRVG